MKKIVIILLFIFNLIVIYKLININVISNFYYEEKYNSLNNLVSISNNVPRGRILDRNGKVLVDNKSIRCLVFNEYMGNIKKEELANILSDVLTFEDDIINKKEYIYNILNSGYSYENKIIKKNITDEEINKVNDLNISSLFIDNIYERVYLYDTCLNSLFGSVSLIPKEELNYYLLNGYSLNDMVGISFLEKTYDKYLRGDAALYKIVNNNLVKVKDSIRGSDLVLSIDIDKQMSIEEALKTEMKNLKSYSNSKYYNGSFIVVSDPNDGSIISLVGLKFDNDSIVSNSISLLNSSYTVGSVVKAASMTVLYKYLTGLDERISDGCVKLKGSPEKCSWTKLGKLNDLDAIKYSSNYYQFINAIKLCGYSYKYDMEFLPKEDDFNKYRDIFKSYGLGDKTMIDINGEELGITGTNITGDLLLNLSIGQYDTYTPLMLNNYINTIANGGVRYKLNLVDKIVSSDKVIKYNKQVLNRIDIKKNDMKRIHEALRSVIENGTARSYGVKHVTSSGKTGTSETFYNNEATITKSFIMYAPSDDPLYAISIISPHIYIKKDDFSYKYPINSKLSNKILNILFEK